MNREAVKSAKPSPAPKKASTGPKKIVLSSQSQQPGSDMKKSGSGKSIRGCSLTF